MKIAISANSADPKEQFSTRFGRCDTFLLSGSEGAAWQDIPNPARDDSGGAGTRVVQLLSDLGVDVVISGHFGPNAFEALQAAGIEAYLAAAGTPQELASQLRNGKLVQATGPSGQGQRGGRGSGRGAGRRRGW